MIITMRLQSKLIWFLEINWTYVHNFDVLGNIVCLNSNVTKLYLKKLLVKSSQNDFIFFPAFYLNMWVLTHQEIFKKYPFLKIWQLVFVWGVKTYFGKLTLKLCIFRHGKKLIFTNTALWYILFSLNIVCIVCRWYFDQFWRQCHIQKTIFASMNQYFNSKLSLFLTEVSFDTPEENQLSYFLKWIFFQNSLVTQGPTYSCKMQVKE